MMDLAVRNKTHHFMINDPWDHYLSNLYTKTTWWYASEIISISIEYPNFGYNKITKICMKEFQLIDFGINLRMTTVSIILSKYKKGWIPDKDPKWLKFKTEFYFY
jgi:hypothetical protein